MSYSTERKASSMKDCILWSFSVTLLKQPACTFEREEARLGNRTVVRDKVAICSAISTTQVLPEPLNINFKSRSFSVDSKWPPYAR